MHIYVYTNTYQPASSWTICAKDPRRKYKGNTGKQLECFVKMLDLLEISSSTSMNPANS